MAAKCTLPDTRQHCVPSEGDSKSVAGREPVEICTGSNFRTLWTCTIKEVGVRTDFSEVKFVEKC